MDFAQLIVEARRNSRLTPRAFHASKDFACSYAYYLRVENGEAIPRPEMAISMLRTLEIDLRRGLFAWARSHMPVEARSIFCEVWDEKPSAASPTSDSTITVTRLTAKLLARDPVLTELVTYLGCLSKFHSSSLDELAVKFGMTAADLQDKLDELYEYGLVDRDDRGYYRSKGWLLVPQEHEFSKLRDLNFQRAFTQINRLDEARRRRTVVTRLLTPEQQQAVEQMLDWLTNWIATQPDEDQPPSSQHYSVGFFSGPRLYGRNHGPQDEHEPEPEDKTLRC